MNDEQRRDIDRILKEVIEKHDFYNDTKAKDLSRMTIKDWFREFTI